MTERSFFPARLAPWLLAFLLLSGFAIRLVDITDLPLDIHPTRQLRSAMIARGMYYQSLTNVHESQRQMAIQQMNMEPIIEPPIMEILAAVGYRLLGGEALWFPRMLSALFWTLGAIGVFGLGRDLTNTDGAVLATAYYLFWPYAVMSSRCFQPDLLMTALMSLSLWALYRWSQVRGWGWALAAGLLAGLAMLVKVLAGVILLGAFSAVVLTALGWKNIFRNSQVWMMALLAALPPVLYQIYGIFVAGYLQSQLERRFFPEMWLKPKFYVAWMVKIDVATGLVPLVMALLGMLLFLRLPKLKRNLLLGLWFVYLIYGLLVPYHITSHDYYNLPLFLIISAGIAPLAALLFQALDIQFDERIWLRWAVVGVLLCGLVSHMWLLRIDLVRTDYRPEAVFWQDMGEKLRPYNTVALLPDYGYRLLYWGWYTSRYWPTLGDFKLTNLTGGSTGSFAEMFDHYAAGQDFFLITRFDELERQPELKEYLFQNYSLAEQSTTHLLFDLRNKKP